MLYQVQSASNMIVAVIRTVRVCACQQSITYISKVEKKGFPPPGVLIIAWLITWTSCLPSRKKEIQELLVFLFIYFWHILKLPSASKIWVTQTLVSFFPIVRVKINPIGVNSLWKTVARARLAARESLADQSQKKFGKASPNRWDTSIAFLTSYEAFDTDPRRVNCLRYYKVEKRGHSSWNWLITLPSRQVNRGACRIIFSFSFMILCLIFAPD
jgi:hypothetical protein